MKKVVDLHHWYKHCSFMERPMKVARYRERDRMSTRSLGEIETSVEFGCDALSADAR